MPFLYGKPDLNIDTTRERQNNSLLTSIRDGALNDYQDQNTFNIGNLNSNSLAHEGTANRQFFIQRLFSIQNEKYNKILIFGKYSGSNSSQIDICFSNNIVSGSEGQYDPPNNIIQAFTIKGDLKADGFFHFSHNIDYVPRYTSFKNSGTDNITNLIIHYTKLQ